MADLTTNNVSLQAVLDMISSLPNAGAGTGGSVETCSIKINYVAPSYLAFYSVIYTAYEDNKSIVKTFNLSNYSMGSISLFIDNVVCNSLVYLDGEGIGYGSSYTINNGDLVVVSDYMPCIYATTANDAEITIQVNM